MGVPATVYRISPVLSVPEYIELMSTELSYRGIPGIPGIPEDSRGIPEGFQGHLNVF
jgi:hypothetical protein